MDSVATPWWSVGKTTERDILSHLILSRLPQFGPATYWNLQQHLGDVGKIIGADFDLSQLPLRAETQEILRAIHRQGGKHSLVQQAQRDKDWLQDNGIAVLTHKDDHYPELLKAISQAPPLLFIKGEINNLFLPQLAMVGSRNPSPTGRENAQRFAQQLSALGFVITSGLALGIDAASHRGALKNKGPTVAVMGTGIDKIYPHSHRQLANDIVEHGGTLISEFPLGSGPHASHFPRRNRIISGMSLGVLVVEAAVKSGSLITARYALQHNREVFAVPGSIHNPVSRGCHALLKEGANLIESVDDMREHLQGLLQLKWREIKSPQPSEQTQGIAEQLSEINRDEKQALEQIGFDPCSLELLEQRTGLAPGPLLSALMGLELKGFVEQIPGGYHRLPEPI
jgi:DNA processing protein